MKYFPINIDVNNRECVVVGGGTVASRKVTSLLKAGAKIRLISPDLTHTLAELTKNDNLNWINRKYQEGDLEGAFIAFVAVDDPTVGGAVANEAKDRNLLINVADIPSQCTFTIPSVVEKGDLMLTISTGGKCPSFSRAMRLKLEKMIEDENGVLLDLLGETRETLLKAGASYNQCKDLLNEIIDSETLNLIKKGKVADANDLAKNIISTFINSSVGTV